METFLRILFIPGDILFGTLDCISDICECVHEKKLDKFQKKAKQKVDVPEDVPEYVKEFLLQHRLYCESHSKDKSGE